MVAKLLTIMTTMAAFMIAAPSVYAVDTLIRENTVGSTATTLSGTGSGLLQVGGVTWDNGDGSLGITKISFELKDNTGSCTTGLFLAKGTVSVPTDKVYANETPTLTTSFAYYDFTFTPTYSADDTLFIGRDTGTCTTVKAASNNSTQVWGSAANIGLINGNPYQVPRIAIYGDEYGALLAPTATMVYPVDGTTYGATSVPYRYASNLCQVQFPNLSLQQYTTFERDSDDTVGETWGSYGSFESTLPILSTAASYADPDCSSGLTYGFGSLPDAVYPLTFPAGHYRAKVKIREVGDSYGADSSWIEFDVSSFPVGGGGGGSWGGGGSGSQEDWSDSLDTAWADKPTCTIISFDFLGTSSGDGMACFGEWLRFMIIPPADSVFDYVTQPLNMLGARWPFAYFTEFYTAFQAGLSTSTACPLPTMAAVEFGTSDQETPEIDFCDWLSPLAGYIENTTFETYIVYLTYLSLIGYALYTVRDFFS